MPRSMTGYGESVVENVDYSVQVEVKAINHRYLELVFRSGRSITPWEDSLRQIIRSKLYRGKLEVYIYVEFKGDTPKKFRINDTLASEYKKSLDELAASLSLKPVRETLSIALLPEVLEVVEKEDYSTAKDLVVEALSKAIEKLVKMREQEGYNLAQDLILRINIIKQAVANIEQLAPTIVTSYEDNLRQKLADYLELGELDETRLTQEVALFSDKVNVTEEIVRLYSHLEQAMELLMMSAPIGRKLDFLIQEINREVNTIGSKANNMKVTKIVVDIKSEVEKIREQVQNLE